MASYLNKFIGKYRVIADYDLKTNDFPTEFDGGYADSDLYIKCQKGGKIFYYGNGVLEFYCPSLQRGRSIIKQIKSDGLGECIISTEESSSEVIFKFNAKDIESISKYLFIITSGASIKPHSVKNLPKTKYIIPDKDLEEYKALTNGKEIIQIAQYTKNFIASLATKKNTLQMIKSDMRLKGIKGKDYIHSIGMWEKYLKSIQKDI